MTLGLTDGSKNAGMVAGRVNSINILSQSGNKYGQPVGTDTTWNHLLVGGVGITTDTEKSGIVADLSDGMNVVIKY